MNNVMTIEDVLKEGEKRLLESGIDDFRLDAWYLLESVLNITKTNYLINRTKKIENIDYLKYFELIQKRCERIPLAYILNEQEFMGLKFFINENVLIPRQDTEILVEEVLKYSNSKSIIDMCTGSGCIIISILKHSIKSFGIGVDISSKAIEVAKHNAILNDLNQMEFIESDLFTNINQKFDIIVSNPPYIKTDIIKDLMPEVLHEPANALDGHKDGLYFYKEIISNAEFYLNSNGRIFFEIGYDQSEEVTKLLEEYKFKNIKVIKDYAGLDRVVHGQLKTN